MFNKINIFINKFFYGLQNQQQTAWTGNFTIDAEEFEGYRSYEMVKQILYQHFDKGWFQEINCDSGWLKLISDCHEELFALDPEYKIFQIKEKFGSLRFYCASNVLQEAQNFRNVINKYEKLSTKICEISGKDGVLMKKNGIYKTLEPTLGHKLGFIETSK